MEVSLSHETKAIRAKIPLLHALHGAYEGVRADGVPKT